MFEPIGDVSRREMVLDVIADRAEGDVLTYEELESLLMLLAAAGVAFVITVPGADDVMLGYQSLSFHDVLVARRTLGLRPAPEFEYWLRTVGMVDDAGHLTAFDVRRSPLRSLTSAEAL